MKILNRRAKYDYDLLENFEAGISLTGTEVKAVRGGKVDLSRSYVKEVGGELILINAIIGGESRSRKLLLHKKEIVSLKIKIEAKKLTLIPTRMYTRGRLIKLEFATAKGKRTHQKRETLRQRDIERDIERELKIS